MSSQAVLNGFVITFSLISFILVLIPLPFHLKMKNTPACIYIFWLALISFNQFINSIIWNGNTVDWAPVWCDISSRIIIAGNVAVPAAALCVLRHLYNIVSMRAMQWSQAQKRLEIYINMAIGIGIPLLSIPSYYIVQDSRYTIFEDQGCQTATSNTNLGIVFVNGLPLYVSAVTSVYSVLIVHKCVKNYAAVRAYMTKTGSSKQYIRLAALAFISSIATTTLSLWIIVNDAQVAGPWPGWTVVHADWDAIGAVPYAMWSGFALVQASRWFIPLCAFTFFAFFGFANEVWAGYGRALHSVLAWAASVRGKIATPGLADLRRPVLAIQRGSGGLPLYHTQPTRHSLASAFAPDRSCASFESTVPMEEKYPWVGVSSVGTLPDTPQTLAEGYSPYGLPSRPAATFSPENSLQSFSSTKGLIPRR
ncbi:STE3-domain-containing protein [Athelia psychrophila]|uniref:STE3-domain-containing protein n=1 Tax=Athelia psychrophila TaxID=1759441 RepID=A0A166R562_9AGAM|nr:STE3-domain-containing protein [Fibularhizoctonia sp. CBS 109695]